MLSEIIREREPFTEDYERWRHGGWYTCARYPGGACGCVSNNYTDKKWRIACGDFHDLTFSSRSDAAKAEYLMVESAKPLIAVLLECREMLSSVGAEGDIGEMPDPLLEKLIDVLRKAGVHDA